MPSAITDIAPPQMTERALCARRGIWSASWRIQMVKEILACLPEAARTSAAELEGWCTCPEQVERHLRTAVAEVQCAVSRMRRNGEHNAARSAIRVLTDVVGSELAPTD